MYGTEATLPPRRWGKYVVALVVGYALLCLGGVYADARFLSYFDVSYWNHLAPIDFLTGFISFFRVALTPSFMLAFVLLILLLTVVGIGLFSLVKTMRTGDHTGRLFRRPVASSEEMLPFPEEPEEKPLWAQAQVIYAQPYAALAIVAVAAFVGLHVAVAAEERNLVEFAGDFRNNRADPTDYQVVAVGRVEPAATWGHMVNLRSSSN
jgi:hypothetical protein